MQTDKGEYMHSNIKMIVTDLDGTLLRTDKTISDFTKTVLHECKKEGLKVVYATGRGASAAQVAAAVFFDGKITTNGATAEADGITVYKSLIPYQTARPILVGCNERGIKITTETGNMNYSNYDVTDLWPDLTNSQIVDFSHHEVDAAKIYSPNISHEDKDFIEKLIPDDLYSVVTSDITGDFLQIMHKDATKAKAVSAFAQLWAIQPSEIVAFGDELNDVDMLTFAGVGVAMENAVDEVKAAADFVCLRNDEDGVARWIAENIL